MNFESSDCELCQEARFTQWFYEDEYCWIAECESCYVPMVVWRTHHNEPDQEIREYLHGKLSDVVNQFFDYDLWIDDNMRAIPNHYHAHARPKGGFYGHDLKRKSD